MPVILKSLNINPARITSEFLNKFLVTNKVYGITQDPKTKNYIMVLDYICETCKSACYAIYFQQNLENWTSGSKDIDRFIRNTQLSNHDNKCQALEWIPYDSFDDIEYIAKGGFGLIYRARWIDGHIDKWDNDNKNWGRKDQNMFVALKILNKSKNVKLEFMNEITSHYKLNSHKCIIKLYGISQDPETENYIMVLDYAENGDFRSYLDANYNKLSWNNKINYLHSIAHGLKDIHESELIHRDLHIAEEIKKTLSQWFRESFDLESTKYAEIKNQIKEAEIFNISSDSNTFSTSLGLSYETHSEAIYTSRPLNFDNLPEPKNSDDYYKNNDNIISKEFSESLQINISQLENNNNLFKPKISNNISKKSLESLQVGTSQLFIGNGNISELENSVEHYEQDDNIAGKESLESLQINATQLKIDDNKLSKSINIVDYEKNNNILIMESSVTSLKIDIPQSNTNMSFRILCITFAIAYLSSLTYVAYMQYMDAFIK
ncbi:kinase-like domain-containing protein [Rhizophagus irregularis DAOM 181602=DAOM 197198]|nr:kinase-like domain-containing protein [Rhizophagus irregularis DAOM 181602=DAOM 197198]